MKTIVSKTAQDVSGNYQRWLVTYSDGSTEIFSLNLRNNTWSNALGQSVNPDTGEIITETQNPFGPDFGPPTTPTGPTGPTAPVTGPTVPVTGPTLPTGIMAFDVFRDILTSFLGITDVGLLQDIYNASTKYLNAGLDPYLIPDLLAGSADAPASFKAFLGDFNKIKQLDVGVTTLAEFSRARNDYKALLRYYGMSEIATDANADKFLMNQVSVEEANARMQTAFNAVKYADEALKQQLKTYFPSLTDKDIVASILGVGQTVAELQKKIGISGIRAESATAGLTGRLSAEELFAQGVSREEARQGYQEVKAQKPLAEAAASRAREDASTIQTELEKESLLGLKSKRRAQLAAREQAYFAGRSGTSQVSLGGSTSGAF